MPSTHYDAIGAFCIAVVIALFSLPSLRSSTCRVYGIGAQRRRNIGVGATPASPRDIKRGAWRRCSVRELVNALVDGEENVSRAIGTSIGGAIVNRPDQLTLRVR